MNAQFAGIMSIRAAILRTLPFQPVLAVTRLSFCSSIFRLCSHRSNWSESCVIPGVELPLSLLLPLLFKVSFSKISKRLIVLREVLVESLVLVESERLPQRVTLVKLRPHQSVLELLRRVRRHVHETIIPTGEEACDVVVLELHSEQILSLLYTHHCWICSKPFQNHVDDLAAIYHLRNVFSKILHLYERQPPLELTMYDLHDGNSDFVI